MINDFQRKEVPHKWKHIGPGNWVAVANRSDSQEEVGLVVMHGSDKVIWGFGAESRYSGNTKVRILPEDELPPAQFVKEIERRARNAMNEIRSAVFYYRSTKGK